jgi:hypothetical protein
LIIYYVSFFPLHIEKMTQSQYTLLSIDQAPRGSTYKYIATFVHRHTQRTKRTPFGARGYEDYTQHKDRQRRERYRIRHHRDLRTGDPTRAGFLSYYVLWGDSTSLQRNIQAYRRMFHLSSDR